MIYVHSVTSALFGILSADPVLTSSGYIVEEGEAFNRDINNTPWVGIYYGNLTIDPQTLGGVKPWEAQMDIFLYVQEGSHRSGQEVTRRLSRAQSAVLNAVNSNKTLNGSVLMTTGMEINPFQRDLTEDTWLFTNEIAFKTTLRG